MTDAALGCRTAFRGQLRALQTDALAPHIRNSDFSLGEGVAGRDARGWNGLTGDTPNLAHLLAPHCHQEHVIVCEGEEHREKLLAVRVPFLDGLLRRQATASRRKFNMTPGGHGSRGHGASRLLNDPPAATVYNGQRAGMQPITSWQAA